MHASGIGKALLAHAEPARIEKYVTQKKLESFTANTICKQDELAAELIKIKAQGYAFDDEEKNVGMRCIAAPIFNIYGEAIAGISISGPTIRLSRDQIKLVSEMVKSKARSLSTHLAPQSGK